MRTDLTRQDSILPLKNSPAHGKSWLTGELHSQSNRTMHLFFHGFNAIKCIVSISVIDFIIRLTGHLSDTANL